MSNKKGGVTAIFVSIAFVVVIGIIIYFLFSLTNNIFYEADDIEGISTYGNSTINSMKSASIPIGDTMILIIFLGVAISLIVTAIYVDMHPVLIGLFLLIFIEVP